MRHGNTVLCVFARAPVPGYSKTRLISALGADGAAALHQRLTERCIAHFSKEAVCESQLWCADAMQRPFFRTMNEQYGVQIQQQQGKDLGERMYHAAHSQLSLFERVIIIGTDCPSLDTTVLQQAIDALQTEDAVFAPAEDGGYVLIGLRRVDPRLFTDIAWGGALVMDATRQRLRELGWRWRELAPQWDIDTPRDLARLAGDERLGPDYYDLLTRASLG